MPYHSYQQTAFNLDGSSYNISTPEETLRGTATIQGKFNVVSKGKTITLTNPSKATLKYYIQTYGNVTHVGTSQGVAYGSDELFHFIEIPKQYPITPIVTADVQTNSGDVCNHWDAVCHAQQGLDTIIQGVVQTGEGITTTVDEGVQWANDGLTQTGIDFQKSIDQQIENYTTWMNKAQQDLDDALAATAKAAQDTAAAAGEGATKGMTDTLKIAGVAALGLGILLVMKK